MVVCNVSIVTFPERREVKVFIADGSLRIAPKRPLPELLEEFIEAEDEVEDKVKTRL